MSYPWILYHNILSSGTMTASSETTTSGQLKEYSVDWKPFVTQWRPTTATAPHYVAIDHGTGKTSNPDTLCVIDHNLYTIGANYTVQYSDDGASWSNAFSPVTATSNKLFYKTFTVASAHRYWRFYISGVALTDRPSVGMVCVGNRLTFPEGLQPGWDPSAETAYQTSPVSEAGVFLGANVRRIAKEFTLEWDGNPGITQSFFDDTTYPVLSITAFWRQHAGRQAKPFFFSWDDSKESPWFCRLTPETMFSAPFGDTYLRRGLTLTCEAYVEV